MHHNSLSIRQLSLLLALIAGFCDTVTFLAGNEVFSAHVTGNFIVLAYDLVNYADAQAWLKLLTFPIFILAVITGRWIDPKIPSLYALLRLEGFLLIGCGFQAVMAESTSSLSVMTPWITLQIVFAMGLQNTFGKLYSQETYGPTTVMTGNVTQAALDTTEVIMPGSTEGPWVSLQKQVTLISGFLAGCILGALGAQSFGIDVVILPGLVLFSLFFRQVLRSPKS